MADVREFLFTNNATASLAADVSPGDTSVQVASGKGALFPSPLPGQLCKITLQNVVTGNYEIMNCVARSGDVLSVERAVEGTTAIAFTTDTAIVQHRITAETLEKLHEAGGTGGDGGAASDAPYITYAATTALSAEKVLTAETGILTLTDLGSQLQLAVAANGITDEKIRHSAGLSIIGRATNTDGSVADITAVDDGGVFRRDGVSIGFGSILQSSVTGLVTTLTDLQTDITTLSDSTSVALATKANASIQITTQYSITGGGDLSSNRTLNLVGDLESPGSSMYYGTDGTGARGWHTLAVGGVTDHGELTGLTDDDHAQYHNNARGDARYPLLSRTINTIHSISGGGDLSADRSFSLIGDVSVPGASRYYGTNSSGTRGWYVLPTSGVSDHGALTGLTDDDHPQYFDSIRGDARYVQLTRAITTQYSITGGGDLSSNRTLSLVGDVSAPGNSMYYGTDASGVRGWYASSVGGVTDHGALTGLTDDDHTQYFNQTRGDARYPLLTRAIATQHSLTGGGDLSANRTLSLVGDVASPGNNMVYSTNSSGVRGWLASNAHTHAAADVTSGTFASARISQASVTQHQAALALAATQVTSGTFANARIAVGNVTQHQASLAIAATQISSGTLVDARVAESNVTQHQTALVLEASQVTSGVFGTARLGTGTASTSTYLRGDGAWVAPTLAASQITSGVFATTRLGTGTASASTYLRGDGTWVAPTNNPQYNSLGIGTPASTSAGDIRATGNVTAYYTSDNRLKQNVRVIETPIEKIKQLRGVRFDWTNEFIQSQGGEDGVFVRRKDVGVIAQEVEAIFPELVSTRPDGYKGVKYDRLVAVLIEAVKELASRVPEVQR